MLYSPDTNSRVKYLSPQRKKVFEAYRKRLSDADYEAICDTLIQRFHEKDIDTSSWIPGNDWSGTVYEPIHHACGGNIGESGKFFGILLFKLLMEYEGAAWSFGRYAAKGMTYFRIDDPFDR